jgi:hypothetical protein
VERDKEIPKGLSDMVLKCLAIDLTQRYQTAGELYADLEAWRSSPGTFRTVAGTTIALPAQTTAVQAATKAVQPTQPKQPANRIENAQGIPVGRLRRMADYVRRTFRRRRFLPIESSAIPSLHGKPFVRELRITPDADPSETLRRLANKLGGRAWMINHVACRPFVLEGILSASTIDELVAYAIHQDLIELDITDVISYSGRTTELLLLALYPLESVRSIAGVIHRSGSRFMLQLEDLLDLLDPSSYHKDIPRCGLEFKLHIVPIEDLLV